mgnify:CR=1 FL=1
MQEEEPDSVQLLKENHTTQGSDNEADTSNDKKKCPVCANKPQEVYSIREKFLSTIIHKEKIDMCD